MTANDAAQAVPLTATAAPVAAGRPGLPAEHDIRELRLALVCYGGVSLAIYMHGITKELEKLTRASAQLVADPEQNPFRPDQSEHAYFDALKRKAAQDGYRTRVVVDIISGTSAGGINGVCLAKSLALDAPQDGLRDLWLSKGAILKLRRELAAPAAARRQPDAEVDQRGVQRHGRQGKGLADAAGPDAEPVRDRDGHPRLQPAAPGRRPAGRQHGRQQARLRVLRPAGHRQPRRHAQRGARVRRARDVVLPGRVPGDEAGRHHTRRRRATRSPPSSAAPTSSQARRSTRRSSSTAACSTTSRSVTPFARSRGSPPRRRSTGGCSSSSRIPSDPQAGPDGAVPGFRKTIWAGLSTLPRRQPIGDALDELMVYNRRVRRVRQMIGAVEDEVLATVKPLLELDYDAANKQGNSGAIESNPFGFQAYLRLKLLSVVEGMESSISRILRYSPQSAQALFVRNVLILWADSAQAARHEGRALGRPAGLPAHVRPRLRAAAADVRDRPGQPLLRRSRPRAAEPAQARPLRARRGAEVGARAPRGSPAARERSGDLRPGAARPLPRPVGGDALRAGAQGRDRRVCARASRRTSTRRSTASARARTRSSSG